jgi:hypothetical protein
MITTLASDFPYKATAGVTGVTDVYTSVVITEFRSLKMKSVSGSAINDCPNLETAKLVIPLLDAACSKSLGGARTSKIDKRIK